MNRALNVIVGLYLLYQSRKRRRESKYLSDRERLNQLAYIYYRGEH